MNKFKYYFILSVATLSLFSCSKDEETVEVVPPRDYAEQYATDIADIEEYLKTYYITVVDHPGFQDDQDVTFTKIPAGGTQASIWSYKDSAGFPKLLTREVNRHGFTYILYYVVLREGSGESPCNVDEVLTSYRGDYLQQVTTEGITTLTVTQFEEVKNPQSFLSLFSTIPGWGETFPKFKTGTYMSNTDGTVSYNDFGAGIMFIPSGLAYFAAGSNSIPSYAPLVFSFKLYEIKRSDIDVDFGTNILRPDGIPSYLEDLNGDGYIYDYRNLINYPTSPAENPDDTDKDGVPDFLDVDDDGDNYTTKIEIKDGNGVIYPFASIPSCDGNTTDPARIKKYLDKSCH